MYLVFSKKSFLDMGPIWNYDLTRSCCQLENDGEDDDDDDDDDITQQRKCSIRQSLQHMYLIYSG